MKKKRKRNGKMDRRTILCCNRKEGTETHLMLYIMTIMKRWCYKCNIGGQPYCDTKLKAAQAGRFYLWLIIKAVENRDGMVRREVHCSRCGSHLGDMYV